MEPDNCAVCHDVLQPGGKKILRCGHEFHVNCINEALKHRARCPMCNIFITPPMPVMKMLDIFKLCIFLLLVITIPIACFNEYHSKPNDKYKFTKLEFDKIRRFYSWSLIPSISISINWCSNAIQNMYNEFNFHGIQILYDSGYCKEQPESMKQNDKVIQRYMISSILTQPVNVDNCKYYIGYTANAMDYTFLNYIMKSNCRILLPKNTYIDSCVNIVLDGDYLHADCTTKQGKSSTTRNSINIKDCISDIFCILYNDNGILTTTRYNS